MIGDNGTQYGVVSLRSAFDIAEQEELDLVEVSPNAQPPVVKLIDYGKYRYQVQKKAQEAKKKQVVVNLKEIKLRPNIEKHDLDVKLKKIGEFLDDGDKVKMFMQFRGREMAHFALGKEKFQSILDQIEALGGAVEGEMKVMGNRILAMIIPAKKVK